MTKRIEQLTDLAPDPENTRSHSTENIGMIETALADVGAARSIVIDEDGVVLAGNATIDAATRSGLRKVQVVDADGDTIIAVRRTGLTSEQKKRLAIYDNRAAELATWNPDVLAGLAANDTAIRELFSDEEWGKITLVAPADAIPDVEFKEYDESVENDVEYLECPSCGHKWPK